MDDHLDVVIGASVGGGLVLFVVVVLVVTCCIWCCIRRVRRKRRDSVIGNMPAFKILDPNNGNANNALARELNGGDNTRQLETQPLTLTGETRNRQISITQSKSHGDYSYIIADEIRMPRVEADYEQDKTTASVPKAITIPRTGANPGLPSPYSEPITTMYGSTSRSGSRSPVATPPTSPSALISSSPPGFTISPSDPYMTPATNEEALYLQIRAMNVKQIHRQAITIETPLGSGQFGYVMQCTWQKPADRTPLPVACKTLKVEASPMDKIKFLQEAAIMGQFSHLNVMQLYGVVTVGEPIMIVLELLANDLKKHLMTLKPGGHMCGKLLSYCQQIASGMAYLADKGFIHRDLAARNVLLTDDFICKIGDFGMARNLMDEQYYISQGGKIPIKWTAPEAISYKKYSSASDVWSYGIVMFEIWSLGHKPFDRHTNKETLDLVEGGYRLPPPPGCPRTIYEIMIKCWHPESSCRPTFDDLMHLLPTDDHQLTPPDLEPDLSGRTSSDVSLLGASLQRGNNLYPDLQDAYV